MADVQLHGIIRAISGKVGDIVFKKLGDKVYISRRPDFSKRKLSPAQKESVRRFGAAVKHAKKSLADPDLRKPFERVAKRQGRGVYHTIMSEYLRNVK